MEDQNWPERPIYSRRRILALGGAAAAAAAFLAACGSDDNGSTSATTTPAGGSAAPSDTAAPDTAAPTPTETVAVNTTEPTSGGPNAAKFGGGGGDGTVKIGFTAPLTGALAGFGEANPFILDSINKLTADGIMLGDKSYKVEIIQKDVESSSDTAASQAGSLILDDGVDLMLAIATPEMINPVADQCEANGVPCLSTLAPWQPYFLGRGGDPAKGFDWTYHFFWGADQLVGVFADMWQTVETNKIVGLLCPNDPDGNALASPDTGFPAGAKAQRLHDDRSGPVRGRHHRLQRHHRPVQATERRDHHGHPDPSRLRQLLDAGQPAGPQAEAGHDGQGRAVLLRSRGARRHRQRVGQRGVVDAEPSVLQLVDG